MRKEALKICVTDTVVMCGSIAPAQKEFLKEKKIYTLDTFPVANVLIKWPPMMARAPSSLGYTPIIHSAAF
jgi:hypothetical protein